MFERATLVLHAVWDSLADGKLHVWGESSKLYAAAAKGGGRKQPGDKAQRHLFALPHEALRDVLGDFSGSLLLKGVNDAALTLHLPSGQRLPLSSPELLLSEERAPLPASAFRAWDVATLALEAGTALDFLLALPDGSYRGVAFGGSLRFWTTAARFAYELITREMFCPSLQEAEQGRKKVYRAAWEAALTHEEEERLAQLSGLMPPECRAFLPPGAKNVSVLKGMVRDFLDAGIDAYVRERLAATSLLPVARKRNTAAPALTEQWLVGLTSDNATLSGPAEELQKFVTTMREWLGQLTVRAGAGFRTCFRLDAPDATEEQGASEWRVSYYLQAIDDRTLLVSADNVWKERSGSLTYLQHTFENPQERLLADLAKAARLFPLVEESLKTSHPREMKLKTEQAYTFLRQSAPLLEQSGFGVLVPPWWNKPSARPRVKLTVKGQGKESQSLFGLDSIVTYDWTVSLGDTALSAEEFEGLVKLKMPLIQVRGQWVELRPDEIEAAIAFFEKKHRNGNMTLGEALRLGLGQDGDAGLAIEGIEGEGQMQELLNKLSSHTKITEIKAPKAFQGTLRPYQVKGASWLAFLMQFGFGACLADDMGLGKCICSGNLIFMNGTLQKVEDIWDHYAGEALFDGEGYWAEPTEPLLTNSIDESSGRMAQALIKRLYRQQVDTHLRKVRLEDGSSVTITYPHKLLTGKGWTNDLHAGDYVCVPAKLIWDGKPEDPDLVKLLAWQIAEGYETGGRNRVSIVQNDITVLEELKECLQRLSEKYDIEINCPAIYPHSNNRASSLALCSMKYRRFLEAKGYEWGKLSREKRIPDFIMQADLDSVRIFLSNYFEAESSVVASMRSIEISTASPLMIQQLSCLLRRFGIWMRISTKQKHATNGTGIYRPYQIGVLGGNAARTFCREIGFVSERKQKLLENICEQVNNTNVEGIPASQIMSQLVAVTGLPICHFNVRTVYVTGTQQFSLASLKPVIGAIDGMLSGEAEQEYRKKPPSKWTAQTLSAYAQLDKQLLTTTQSKLQQLLGQEVYYCKIKEIEDVPYEGWVYDFEVEEHHNFVANNILCHNTIQLITLLLNESEARQNGSQPDPTLLICPMSIVGNWQKELQRFAPSLKVMIHHGAERLAGAAFAEEVKKHEVLITTYALALRDKEMFAPFEWENLVLDEAQNIKNESAKQTVAIRGLQARHRIALTGTPVENRLSELWSIMQFLNPGYLGNGSDFRKEYVIPIERYHDAGKAEALRRIIQPFVLRRLKTDKTIIKDLPDKLEMKVYCNLTQEQASLYEAIVKGMMEKIENSEGIERKGLVLSTLLRLKQICNHPAQFMGDGSSLSGRSGKLARLTEMLEEALAEGDKALIFTQFAEMGTLLRQHLQETLGCEALFLHGGTPKKRRDVMVQRFQEERRGAQVFILSLKAGGVGLNLTAANHVFHFDRWWNPAVENQATDRAFRIGQQKNVQVHKFVCIGTLEERIDQMIEQKKALAEGIVGAGEAWLTEMSTEQLKEMFALSRSAVGE